MSVLQITKAGLFYKSWDKFIQAYSPILLLCLEKKKALQDFKVYIYINLDLEFQYMQNLAVFEWQYCSHVKGYAAEMGKRPKALALSYIR